MFKSNTHALTLSGGRVGGTHIHTLEFHRNSLGDGWDSRHAHLFGRGLLWLADGVRFGRSSQRWLSCSLRLRWAQAQSLLAVGWCLSGHWVGSGAGVFIREAGGEGRSAGAQHPLHISGEAPSRTLPGQLCSCIRVQAGEQERGKAVIREGGLVGETQEFIHVLLKENIS